MMVGVVLELDWFAGLRRDCLRLHARRKSLEFSNPGVCIVGLRPCSLLTAPSGLF